MSTMEYYATIKTCEVHNKEDKSHTHGTEQRKPQTTVYVLQLCFYVGKTQAKLFYGDGGENGS